MRRGSVKAKLYEGTHNIHICVILENVLQNGKVLVISQIQHHLHLVGYATESWVIPPKSGADHSIVSYRNKLDSNFPSISATMSSNHESLCALAECTAEFIFLVKVRMDIVVLGEGGGYCARFNPWRGFIVAISVTMGYS